MQAKIVAFVVDAYRKEFTDKEGKQVKYISISVRDEEAYRDKDRIATFTANTDLISDPKELIGQELVFVGNLGYNDGVLKFRPTEVEV